jgi:2-polyprenyl-6-methoxyphenol hydroxylase-like FAD-dependent oxidoreductase
VNQTVIIAGGGPTGLLLAGDLRQAGVPAIVLERRAARDTEAYSQLLHGNSIALLGHRGLLDRLRPDKLIRWPFVHFAHIPMDLAKADPEDYWLMVPQTTVEELLAERATGLGADLRHGHEVAGVRQDEQGVTVTVRAPSGDYELTGAYLVGADGGDSAVRELAGFDAPAAGPSWYGVYARIEDYAGPNAAVTVPGGMFGIIPDGPFRHVMTTEFERDTPGYQVPVTFEEVTAAVWRLTGAQITGQPRWLARYGNVTRHPAAYREGRVFLAGDAAHVHFHAVGHGLNTGLHDAANLAWKLAAELNGWAPPGLLDSYDAERHPVGERAVTVMRAQLALLHPLDEVAGLRELFGELAGHGEVVRHLVGAITHVRYPGDGTDPLVGTLLPREAAGALREGRGVLLDLSQGRAEIPDVSGWGDRVTVTAGDPVPGLAAKALLVRPDGYVAWAADSAKGLEAALAAWFGEPR